MREQGRQKVEIKTRCMLKALPGLKRRRGKRGGNRQGEEKNALQNCKKKCRWHDLPPEEKNG